MRISSNFRDYYDGVQSVGQDQSLVFHRYRKTVTVDNLPFVLWSGVYSKYYRSARRNIAYVSSYAVGFCGKVYPVVEVWKEMEEEKGRFCFNLSDIDKFMEENFRQKERRSWYEAKIWSNTWFGFNRQSFKRFFELAEEHKESKKNLPFFEEEHTPIFVAHTVQNPKSKRGYDSIIDYNCPLKDVEFYRLFDPYQTYQEISMWLSNHAMPNKQIPEIPDKTMVEAKGFDPKWSFRKEPKNK